METLKDVVIIYHDHCPDGMGAAWCSWKKFGNKASYIPSSDRNVPPEGLLDKEIYILDYCYPKEVLAKLLSKNKKVIVLDHHISSRDDALSLDGSVFDNNRSGASITWDYFFETKPRPRLIDYLEDGDLFHFSLPHQDKLTHRIIATPFTIESYNELVEKFENDFENVLIEGKAIELYVNSLFESIGEDYEMVLFEGVVIPAINIALPLTTKSQLLNKIYTKVPPMAMSYRYDKGFWKVSLRSDRSIDCSKLAEKYGGGGHAGSAGFVVSADFPLPFVKISDIKK